MRSVFGLRQVVRYCFVLAAIPIAVTGQTKRIAVYDFNFTAVRGDVAHVFGSEKPVGAQVANRIIAKLVSAKGGAFEVIDRNQVDSIMKEQNLKFSDRFDPRDAPKLGKLLNVDAIVTGSVDQLADQLKNNRVGLGPIGLGKVESVADVTVSVRVISTETGRIFIADQVNNQQAYSLGRGGKVGRNGTEGESQNAHPAAVPADRALQAAADDIAAKIIAKADELPVRSGAASSASRSKTGAPGASTPPASGGAGDAAALLVGRIDGGKIYITGGENAGLKVNDRFEVRHVTGTMKDAAGRDIETDERVDTVVVTDVEEKFAVAKSVNGGAAAIKVGDRLKRVKAAPAGRKGNALAARPVQKP